MSKRSTSSKFSNFFKFRSGTSEPSLYESLRLDSARPTDPIDANEIIQQLLPGNNTLSSRLRVLEELSLIIQEYPFRHTGELWVAVEDLLEPGVPHHARKAAWTFMMACINGQFDELGMLRAVFYQVINNHEIWEDFNDKLAALNALTKDGRDVYGFEKNIVRLLAHWIESSFEQAKTAQHVSQQRIGMQKSSTSLSLTSTPHLILLTKPIPHFASIMALMINVVKFNFVFFDELEIARLLVLLHTICINAPEDIGHTLGFLDVIVRYGYVPADGLSTFLKILCHTVLVDQYQNKVWQVSLNLLQSHCAHGAIRILCLNLRPKEGTSLSAADTRVVQGSIRLLESSIWGPAAIETLNVADSTVLWSLRTSLDFQSRQIDQDVATSLEALLVSKARELGDLEYDVILEIMECLTRYVFEARQIQGGGKNFVLGAAHATLDIQPYSPLLDIYARILFLLIDLHREKQIQAVANRLITLLATCQQHLPEDAMVLLLDFYATEHYFYPYTQDWLERLHTLMTRSVLKEHRVRVRTRALEIALDVYYISLDFFHDEFVQAVFMELFDNLPAEVNDNIASETTKLLIDTIRHSSDALFPRLLDTLVQVIKCSCVSAKPGPQSSFVSRFVSSGNTAQASGTPSCQSTAGACGLIDLLQHSLYDVNGASRVDDLFRLLTNFSGNPQLHKETRMVMLDFLLCLRVDLDHRIYCLDPQSPELAITDQPWSEPRPERSAPQSVPRSVGSTPTTHPASRQSVGGASRAQPTLPEVSVPPLWRSAWRPLMSGRTMQASPYVISYLEIASTADTGDQPPAKDDGMPAPLVGYARMILNIPLYLTVILQVLQTEKDWDLYSFVMQRLPMQLFNKHLFCNSGEQIKQLISSLVTMTSKDKIPEALRNLPLNAKRHDIHVLAYRVLVILLCYRSRLKNHEQHDLVQAFVVGLQRQATCAKICIHALSICCFELPKSITKHLSITVMKLSQIMSTATISVHILEFLATVARIPSLYANFVENDYKRVFGIALKYIQYTHTITSNSNPSTPQSGHPSPASPMASPGPMSAGARALPQYVLIMAYQVIDVWFILQRLSERRKYVPYIVRNLLMANEASKKLDDHTEICLDMLARYTYANYEPKPKPPLVHELLVGAKPKGEKVMTKTWLNGLAFVTVRTTLSVGWAEITVRRCSGTISFLLKVENPVFTESGDTLDETVLPGLMRLHHEAHIDSALVGESMTESADQSLSRMSSVKSTARERVQSDDEQPSPALAKDASLDHHRHAQSVKQRLGEHNVQHFLSLHATPQHSPLHTPQLTPRASPMPSGENTPAGSPPSTSPILTASNTAGFSGGGLQAQKQSLLSRTEVFGGHNRVQTAPLESSSSSPSVSAYGSHHPLSVHPTAQPLPSTSNLDETANASSQEDISGGNLGRSKSASGRGSVQLHSNIHAELSRGPLGSALEQTKSLLTQSMVSGLNRKGSGAADDGRRSISLASSRNNSITTAMGIAFRHVGQGHHGGGNGPATLGASPGEDHYSIGSSIIPGHGGAASGGPSGVLLSASESAQAAARQQAKIRQESFVDPSFMFMTLNSFPDVMSRETPILLPEDEATNRAIAVLDRTPVVDFHKIGILYVGKGQTNETEILGNSQGSAMYTQFLAGMGRLVRLKDAKVYTGGLDTSMDLDGEFGYVHQDEITHMAFHVPTMMPNSPHDLQFDGKKRHIGNDWVTIVWNESGQEYDFGTISGQFNFMTLVITPVSMNSITSSESALRAHVTHYHPSPQHHRHNEDEGVAPGSGPVDGAALPRSSASSTINLPIGGSAQSSSSFVSSFLATNPDERPPPGGWNIANIVQPYRNLWFKVVMLRRPDMPEIGPLATPKVIGAYELPSFMRQMAAHANIYAQVYYQHSRGSVEYVSNWQERLRQIKRIKERFQNTGGANNSGTGSGNANTTGGGVGAGASGAAGAGASGGGGPSSGGSSGQGHSQGSSSHAHNLGSGSNNNNIGLGLGLGLSNAGSNPGGHNSSGSNANNHANSNNNNTGGNSNNNNNVSSGTNTGGGGGSAANINNNPVMGLEALVDFTRYA